jgi:hypothetical protein
MPIAIFKKVVVMTKLKMEMMRKTQEKTRNQPS